MENDNLKNFNNQINSIELEKAIKTANILKNMSNKKEIESEKNPFLKLTQNSNTINAILPLMPVENKDFLSNFIHIMDISNLINEYKANKITIKKNSSENFRLKKDALAYIKSQVNDDNKNFIDLIVKFLEINEITNKIKRS